MTYTDAKLSATLTGISYFAEAIQRDKDNERKQYFMNLITESATDAKRKTTDIVCGGNSRK